MSLIKQAEKYIRQFCWDFDQSGDPMWELVVEHESIEGVDVFFYGPRGMFELQGSEQFAYLLAGNAPVLFDKASGGFMVTGTGLPTEEYIKTYLKFGDPHHEPSASLKIDGWESGSEKIAATKAIRKYIGCGLAEAKSYIDDVLEDKAVEVKTESPEVAAALVMELRKLHFNAEQN